MRVDELVAFYQQLTLDRVDRLADFYSADAWFKDPFNEVRGVAAIGNVFRHMFRQVDRPRFVIVDRVIDGNAAVLVWELRFHTSATEGLVRGAAHLKFDPDGKVCYHRDYWDTAEELYMKQPVLGMLVRWVRRQLAAPQVRRTVRD